MTDYCVVAFEKGTLRNGVILITAPSLEEAAEWVVDMREQGVERIGVRKLTRTGWRALTRREEAEVAGITSGSRTAA